MQCERLHTGQMRMKKFSVTSACFCSCRRHFSHRLWLQGSMNECRRSRLHMGHERCSTRLLFGGVVFTSSTWVSLLPMRSAVLELEGEADVGRALGGRLQSSPRFQPLKELGWGVGHCEAGQCEGGEHGLQARAPCQGSPVLNLPRLFF